MKKIGIIGGAGPLASNLLYLNLVEQGHKHGCRNESELPEIIIINYPFSINLCTTLDRNGRPMICSVLQKCIDRLVEQKADLIAIACNTFHLFIKDLNLHTGKLVNIATSALEAAEKRKLSRLLILGTPLTLKNSLYSHKEIACFIPEQKHQLIIEKIIKNILSGKLYKKDADCLTNLIKNSVKALKCDGVVLGCTELPVLHKKYNLCAGINVTNTVKILDTLEILAEKLIIDAI
jgi:aspartate racemase